MHTQHTSTTHLALNSLAPIHILEPAVRFDLGGTISTKAFAGVFLKQPNQQVHERDARVVVEHGGAEVRVHVKRGQVDAVLFVASINGLGLVRPEWTLPDAGGNNTATPTPPNTPHTKREGTCTTRHTYSVSDVWQPKPETSEAHHHHTAYTNS